MEIAVLGIDLGKNSCSVAGPDRTGRVVLRRRVRPEGVIKLADGLPACVMAMEHAAEPIIWSAFFRHRGTRSG